MFSTVKEKIKFLRAGCGSSEDTYLTPSDNTETWWLFEQERSPNKTINLDGFVSYPDLAHHWQDTCSVDWTRFHFRVRVEIDVVFFTWIAPVLMLRLFLLRVDHVCRSLVLTWYYCSIYISSLFFWPLELASPIYIYSYISINTQIHEKRKRA